MLSPARTSLGVLLLVPLVACRSAGGGDGEESPPRPDAPTAALDAAAVSVPPGFAVELLHSVDAESQGSWVTLANDGAGRLYASDQYGALWRITPPAVGAEDEVGLERVEIELGEAQGLCWAFDGLYVVVNHGETFESGLYRVEDTDGDDALDSVRRLCSFDGYGEHGPHAVLLDRDGGLVLVAGNHTQLPERLDRSRVPKLWDEDAVLPRIDDPGGHAVGITAPGGWICRTDPEAQAWELVACGLRNPYDIAFHPSGELFTFDADMEWDVGLPWYRPTRILHIVDGAEFGWRTGSAKWPAHAPDSLPAAVDIGASSPTGIAFGTGARFPERWQRALFAADWAYGKIFAVHLEQDGASWTGEFEEFVSGEPLPVTDLVVAPDGALYFTTGGRRAQSGLYRVTWTGATPEPAEAGYTPTPEALERRALEALQLDPGAELTPAWSALDSPDRHLRFAARTALELRPPAAWRAQARAEDRERASIEALLARVRADSELEASEWLEAVLAWPWETLDHQQKLAALRVVGVGLLRLEGAEAHSGALCARLAPLFPSGSDELDLELCRVLAPLQCDTLADAALDLLESAPSQESAIGYAYALSTLRTGWDDASRARFLRWFETVPAGYSGGASFAKYLLEIQRRSARSLGVSMPASPAGAVRTEPADEPARAFVRAWTVADFEEEIEAGSLGTRSFDSGRATYTRGRCLECHRVAGEGGSTGPDLSGVAGRFGTRDLLEALLEPSKTISDQYQDTEFWTEDGRVEVGRLVATGPGRITVRNTQDEEIALDPASIETRRPHPLSRMPEGLLDTSDREEVLDLLAYLLSAGDPEHALYR